MTVSTYSLSRHKSYQLFTHMWRQFTNTPEWYIILIKDNELFRLNAILTILSSYSDTGAWLQTAQWLLPLTDCMLPWSLTLVLMYLLISLPAQHGLNGWSGNTTLSCKSFYNNGCKQILFEIKIWASFYNQ